MLNIDLSKWQERIVWLLIGKVLGLGIGAAIHWL